MTPAANTIQKLILDLLVRVNKSNNEVFDKFSSIANNSSIPIIQRYFDQIIPDDIVIEIGCGANIWVPNSFTPDEDGVNDFFNAVAVDIPYFSMTVFNRLGQPIFHSDKIEIGWDGKCDGIDAPVGMYGYTCRYTFRNGEKGVKRGSFLLLR